MTRWVMVADLERCVGCQTCTAACRHANATSPAVQWRKVLDVEAGTYPNVSRTFVPVGCQHCDDPPCMHVCPSTATRRRADGIVTIDYDICIGCAYCDVACPYQARFKVDAPRFAYGEEALQSEVEREDPHRIGVAQKCTFCSDRIDFGLANGLTPGLDAQATPACVNSCIADALHFGDIDDPGSNVSRLLREQRHFRMHQELGTKPGFYYVYGQDEGAHAPAPNSVTEACEEEQQRPLHSFLMLTSIAALALRFVSKHAAASVLRDARGVLRGSRPGARAPQDGAAARSSGRGPNAGMLRTRGVEPWHQQHWDWKAAGNFICGGAGTGLFLFAAIETLMLGSAFPLAWTALGLVALGLFLVLLKIGRPLRFAHVLRQPQRSWMTREAWVALFFFPLGAAAAWLDSRVLMVPAAILAACFLFSQGMILREAKGIPAWRAPRIVPLIIATGLAEGAGLLLAAIPVLTLSRALVGAVGLTALILAAIRAWTWTQYLAQLRSEGAPARSLAVLKRFEPWFLALGLALPAVLIVLAWIAPHDALFVVAGLCIAGAGAALKFLLVTRAGYNQGFAVDHLPARGNGVSLSGVKPGWSMRGAPL